MPSAHRASIARSIRRPVRAANCLYDPSPNNVSQQLPPPKKIGDVTEYEIEVPVDELEERIEVPLLEKNTRLIVKLVPSIPLFSV